MLIVHLMHDEDGVSTLSGISPYTVTPVFVEKEEPFTWLCSKNYNPGLRLHSCPYPFTNTTNIRRHYNTAF
jgi:hypothetical protein